MMNCCVLVCIPYRCVITKNYIECSVSIWGNVPLLFFFGIDWQHGMVLLISGRGALVSGLSELYGGKRMEILSVFSVAIIRLVTQSFSPTKRCVTTVITAANETMHMHMVHFLQKKTKKGWIFGSRAISCRCKWVGGRAVNHYVTPIFSRQKL